MAGRSSADWLLSYGVVRWEGGLRLELTIPINEEDASVEAQTNWQTFMMATLVPPAQRIRYIEARAVERPVQVKVIAVECECPEFCRIDHEND